MSVFVSDGNERSTLALVRSLGRAGIDVTVGHSSKESLAGMSRFASRTVVYPSPTRESESFKQFITEELNSGQYRAVFAMTDATTLLLSQVRPQVNSVAFSMPDLPHILRTQDKREVLQLGLKVGIESPTTYMLTEDEDLVEVSGRVRYPAVVRPRFSKYVNNGKMQIGGVEYAASAEELIAKYRASHAKIPYPMIQERISGEGRGVFLLIWNGELKAAFCHQRLREKPPWGGVSVLRESIPLDKELVDKSFRLLQELNWQGVAMVEFKIDDRDARPKLVEINGRFWGSLQLAIDAGLDLPCMLYRLAIGEDVPPQFDYRPGVRSRWFLGDLDHLLITLANGSTKGHSGNNGNSRLTACLEFAKFVQPNTYYEVFKFNDPSPGWFECKAYIRENIPLFAKLGSKN